MPTTVDVVVIGAGPSGLTVSAEVAAGGHRVITLEKRTDVVASRAGTLLPRVLELFDYRGLTDRLIRKSREVRHWPFSPYHLWAGLQPVVWDRIESRFPFTLIMPQNHTESVLMEWARESGADVRMGHEVLSVQHCADHVAVRARSPGGSILEFQTRYLVGADGARSLVRKSLELPFDGHGPTFTGIIADAHARFPFASGFKMVGNQKGWSSCYPFGPGIVRFVIVHAERMRADRSEPVSLDEFNRCVKDIFDADFGVQGLHWASRYTNQMRSVPALRRGRCFLVGESARIHYPASGVGMNFCIQDAFNLGWKLAYVLSGDAPDSLLDSYHSERYPVLQRLLESVRNQCSVQFDFSDEGMTHKRDFESRILPVPEINRRIGLELNGVDAPYPRKEADHRLVGFRAHDLSLVGLDGSMRRLAELLRSRKFLLIDSSGTSACMPLYGSQRSLTMLEAKPVMVPDAERGVQGMLVRPDGYVAWASDVTPEPEDARLAFASALCH